MAPIRWRYFENKKFCILIFFIKSTQKIVPKGTIDNNPVLV